MSLKNVLRLYGVYSKSYRLITKDKFRHYKESRWKTIGGIAALILIGLVAGGLIAIPVHMAWTGASADSHRSIQGAAVGMLVALPVFAILYSLYFTQMSQMQKMGSKVQVQPIYWFPLTWEEHTQASILTTMIAPLAISLIIVPIILICSYVVGLLSLGMLTIISLVACVAMAGTTAEILKGAQQKLTEYVSKRAGRATVWIRFLTTIVFIVIVYVGYFILNRDFAGLAQSLSDSIMIAWFVPYLWPGIIVFEANRGAWLETAAFAVAAVAFTWLLYRIAVRSNAKYALQDTSGFRITRGAYVPRRGLLERAGISPAVAGIMRKDLKAYTRRQELMYVFVTPIIFVVSTLMPFIGGSGSLQSADPATRQFQFMLMALQPSVVLATFLCASAVGSEGERRWFLLMSPLSPRSFIRAKFLFCTGVCLAVALGALAVSGLLYSPPPYAIATAAIESLAMTVAVATVALAFGTRGADFRETAKAQMIQPLWMFGGVIACMIVALAVALPVLLYGGSWALGIYQPEHEYLIAAWAISGAVALAVAYVAYRACIRLADSLFSDINA